jgi:hypothetical protein
MPCVVYVECVEPYVEHALVESDLRAVSVTLTLTCESGYLPHGTEDVTCMGNGQWTTTDLVCTGTSIFGHVEYVLFYLYGNG